MVKRLPIALIVAALLVNDLVTWIELRRAMSWLLGDLAPFAAMSILLLANAVTAAFFFQDLAPKYIRRLHLIAGYLYTVIMLAVYASAVQHGSEHFPEEVARTAFFLPRTTVVTLGAMLVGVALAAVTFVFWGVLGSLIRAHVERGDRVLWQDQAAAAGLPVDNILDLHDRQARADRATS